MDIILGILLCFIAGLIPAIIYSWFVNWLDRHEKEPWWLLALAFTWGAIPGIIIALIAQIILDVPTTWILPSQGLAYEVIGGSLWAPLTEEFVKGLGLVLILIVAHREVDNILDGMIYGAMAGVGFAFTENLFYFGGALFEGGWGAWVFVVLLRTIPFGLNHAFFSAWFGGGLSLAYLSRNPLLRIGGPIGGFVAAVVFHGLHNLGASLAAEDPTIICLAVIANWGGIVLLGILIALIWRQERAWLIEQLPGEVSQETYHMVTSWRRWVGLRFEALLGGNLGRWRRLGRLRHVAIELAFKKRRLTDRGPDDFIEKDIETYRQELSQLDPKPLSPAS